MKLNIPEPLKAVTWALLPIFLGVIIPITLILANSEIYNTTYSLKLFLFSIFTIMGVMTTLMIYFIRKSWNQDDIYGNSFGFFNIGRSPSLSFFKRFTGVQLLLYSLIIFGSLFLFVNVTKQLGSGFTGLSVLPQQFTRAESLAFSTLLIPAGEEMLNLALTGIFVLLLTILAVKYKMNKSTYITLYYFFIPLFIGIFAVLWHLTAYSGSTVGLLTVFVFWWLKELFILVSGFWVIGWVLHSLNNFFIDFGRLYASDVVLFTMIGVIVGLIIITGIIYRGRLLGAKQNETE